MAVSVHPKSPCASCPYRTDAPRGHWSREEFRGLLASENTTLGAVYACHGHAKVEPKERGICAGWLLDQRRRNVPSIRLRMLLATNDAAAQAMRDATPGDGVKLYPTVKAMCRANGVRR